MGKILSTVFNLISILASLWLIAHGLICLYAGLIFKGLFCSIWGGVNLIIGNLILKRNGVFTNKR